MIDTFVIIIMQSIWVELHPLKNMEKVFYYMMMVLA
jgi:hypothetical protein